jgi:hypothetical protein
MPENRNAFITFCLSKEEAELLEFVAKEGGQTKSSFVYVLVRDRLRALGLLPQPVLPSRVNGQPKEVQHA